MHDPWTTDYRRGYEWFIMDAAKNLSGGAIALYGLPWAFPQWVSCNPGTLDNCTNNPYSRPEQTAAYVVSWVEGAKAVYGHSIDYIGSWVRRCDLSAVGSVLPYHQSRIPALTHAHTLLRALE